MKKTTIPTSAGRFMAYFSERGLARLEFPKANSGPTKAETEEHSDAIDGCAHWKQLTQTALESLLKGKAPKDLPPLDLRAGTEFQRRVWRVLAAIPFGQTRSYAEVAEAAGSSKATRAVGQACGANPIPMLIPCHRVLAAGHRLGGFSAGLSWKEKLLALEGVRWHQAEFPLTSRKCTRSQLAPDSAWARQIFT